MRKVTIYTTAYCGFCRRAKQLLKKLQIPFEEIDVEGDDEKREWLVETTGERTVPQIFFGDESIGGCTDLEALVRSGELEKKLGKAAC
jgi:glutaredoxin 3